MGQARQRKLNPVPNGQPRPIRKRKPELFMLVEGQPVDQQQPDGTILRIAIFHLTDEHGGMRVMNTPNGPMPITFASLPIPIGRGLLLPPVRPPVAGRATND